MSDKWEVKSVTKSGDGFNIRIGPVYDGEALLCIYSGLIFGFLTLDLLDLYIPQMGLFQSIGIWCVCSLLACISPIPSMVAAAAIVFVYLIKWFVFSRPGGLF
jgi:hypothetical protein